MPAIPIIAGIATVAGTASSISAQSKASKAASQAAEAAQNPATNGTVDINALDAQAREFAKRNAAEGYALNEQYNPGLNALRQQSLAGVADSLPRSAQTTELANRIAAQAGAAPSASYDSPLLRAAIAQAQQQLALGGALDLETQNAATRGAFAKSGSVTGGLGLGRDLQARDLGLTSLQLAQQRLTNASNLGNSEAALGQGNAALSMQGQIAGTNNLFNSANFLAQLDSGDFARQLNAATLTQNIADPATGLDPGAVANLAVGNSSATAAGQQQAAALKIAAANQKAALGGQIAGLGVGALSKFYTPAVSTPVSTPVYGGAYGSTSNLTGLTGNYY